MKELTIEQKAQRYDEAISIAKKFYTPDSNNVNLKATLEMIFHELAESEDERIRKELIEFVKSRGGFKQEYIDWLEKQAQKQNVNCLLSWSEIDENMFQSLEGIVKDYWAKAEQEKNEIKIREASNVSYFLKTIQKSPLCWIKCSERLPNRDGTYLVVTDGRHNDVYDMARYDSIEGWHKASEIIYWMPIPQLNNKSIIEQKPAWSKEDKNMLEWVIAYLNNKMLNTSISEERTACKNAIAWLEKQGIPAKLSEEEQNRFAKGVLTSCALSFINYLDTHKYESKMCVSNGECEDIENAFHNAMWDRLHRYYCKYIEKQGEQKPVIEMKTPEESLGVDSDTYNKIVDECIYGEQKPTWSEEDEEMLNLVIKSCEQCGNEYAYYWLKSLKDRVQSKKQMKALK